MNTSKPLAAIAMAAAALAVAAAPAHAQSGSTATSSGYSLLPGTTGGYVGLSVGRSDYDLGCGADATLGCDDRDTAFKITTGGMFTPYFGLEAGYLHMGNADRAGGRTRAQGLNLSLVGRVPLGQFAVFGKIGATYGHTRVSAAPSAGLATGSESGWGASYAVGASYDLTSNWALMLELERHEFRFAGQGREPVDSATLGVKYRF